MGSANWWREAHSGVHKRVLHFFANRPPGAGIFFSNLLKMLVTGITTKSLLVAKTYRLTQLPNPNVKTKVSADYKSEKWLNPRLKILEVVFRHSLNLEV